MKGSTVNAISFSIAPRQRGAWIETRLASLESSRAFSIAPRQRGAWIETCWIESAAGGFKASPPGNGGRGLKLRVSLDVLRQSSGASPPGNGGRGLKQWSRIPHDGLDHGIAPRQRGAWIETCVARLRPQASSCIAPRQRGAWIETDLASPQHIQYVASPPGNGGRGLKPFLRQNQRLNPPHRPPATGGVD